ncbi:hypothetical protein M0765_017205 [Variovorax sp. S2]|uniref:hypothetical protein n=1 Tax=Variovorax sp. S12S4 TaxID=3029170 RepID=UPI00215C459B|nr:hypothetical protein [Variovorax sp. S12S4]MCR8959409.1 hypothetical protein [Variovorax sp. S12S4]
MSSILILSTNTHAKRARISSEPFFLALGGADLRFIAVAPFTSSRLQLHKGRRKFSFGNKITRVTTETKYCI